MPKPFNSRQNLKFIIMKNFDELFAEAKQVSDHRKQVFNRLIEKTQNEILPKFCEACAGFDIKIVYFKTMDSVLSGNDSEPVQFDEVNYYYYYAINVQEQTIQDAKYNHYEEKYYVPEYWEMMPISRVQFSRVAIVEFVHVLNSRLESYVKKYSQKNEEAAKL